MIRRACGTLDGAIQDQESLSVCVDTQVLVKYGVGGDRNEMAVVSHQAPRYHYKLPLEC